MKSRFGVGLAVGTALALLVSACGSNGEAGGAGGAQGSSASYIIASSQSLTGSFGVAGVPLNAGFQTAIDKVNASGGVNGHELVLKTLDDANNPARAVSNTKQLLESKPVAFLAPVGGATSAAMLPTLERAKVPMFMYIGVPALLPSPYYYAEGLNTTDGMILAGQYLKAKVAGTKPGVAFVALNTPASSAAVDSTKKYVEGLGWKVVADELFDPENAAFDALAAKIKRENPDYIIGGADDARAPGMMTALRNAGVTAPVVNFQAASSESTFAAIQSPQYISARDFVDPSDPSPDGVAMREAAQKYGTASNATNIGFTKGYVLGNLLAEALASCGNGCTGEKVAQWMDGMQVPFLSGTLGPPLKFSATDHSGTRSGTEYQWSAEQRRAVAVSPLLTAEGASVTVKR